RVWPELPGVPGVAEKPPPEKRREKGSDEPNGSCDVPAPPRPPPVPGWAKFGSTVPADPVSAETLEAGWVRPWTATPARTARKAATLVPPTMARVRRRLSAAVRRARPGAGRTAAAAAPAAAPGAGRSKSGYHGVVVADGGAGAVGRGSAGTAVDDGSITGPAAGVGGVGGSSGWWSDMSAPEGLTESIVATGWRRLGGTWEPAGTGASLVTAPSAPDATPPGPGARGRAARRSGLQRSVPNQFVVVGVVPVRVRPAPKPPKPPKAPFEPAGAMVTSWAAVVPLAVVPSTTTDVRALRSVIDPETVLVIVAVEGTMTVAVEPSRCVTVTVLPSILLTVPKTPPPLGPKARAPLAPVAPAPLVPRLPRARLPMAPAWVVVDGVFFRLAPAAAPPRATTTRAAMAIGRRTRKPLAGPELGHRSPSSAEAGAGAGGTGGSVSSGFMSVAPCRERGTPTRGAGLRSDGGRRPGWPGRCRRRGRRRWPRRRRGECCRRRSPAGCRRSGTGCRSARRPRRPPRRSARGSRPR